MHELSLVTELVAECVQRAGGRRVAAVQVRCPDGVDAGELADAFSQLTAGGVLAGAALEIETVPQVLTCGCGFSGEVDPEQCAGHMVICPACSLVHEAPDALELIAVRFPDDRGGQRRSATLLLIVKLFVDRCPSGVSRIW